MFLLFYGKFVGVTYFFSLFQMSKTKALFFCYYFYHVNAFFACEMSYTLEKKM